MSAHTIEAHAANGRRYQLTRFADSEHAAAGLAVRAATLLAAVGEPQRWGGSRVVVRHLASGMTVLTVRISPKRRAN